MSKTYELSYTAERIDEILKEVDEHTVYSDATTEESGLMSATDKTKLDALPTAQQIEGSLSEKVDKVEGKGLSENDYTDAEKESVASAYHKPQNGIPKTDLDSRVQTSLDKADTALQSFTETDPTVPSWAKQPNKPSYNYSEIGNTPDLSGFITKSVNDLTNYYLKSETYTKAEVAALIGAIQQFHYEIYQTLPSSGESNVLYLIGPTGSGSDRYEEYVYANNAFTKIGDTSIDLSGYVTTTALNTALADYTTTSSLTALLSNKADKVSNATSGNFAGLDANGNPTDSGSKASDFATASQGAKADTAYQKPSSGIPESDLSSDVQSQLNKHFKGWYASSSALPDNPVVGDYAYVKGAESTDPAAIYECTTEGSWSDSGRTADTSNVQTFASGEEVNETSIDNDFVGGSDKIAGAEEVKTVFIDNAKTSNSFNFNFNGALATELNVRVYTSNNTITTTSYQTRYFAIPCKGGDVIEIERNDTLATNVYFLKTLIPYRVNQPLVFSEESGFTIAQNISVAGYHYVFTVPQDVTYILVQVRSDSSSTNNQTPKLLKLNGVDLFKSFSERVDERVQYGSNLSSLVTLTGFYRESGSVVKNNNWKRCLLEVKPGDVVVTNYNHNVSYTFVFNCLFAEDGKTLVRSFYCTDNYVVTIEDWNDGARYYGVSYRLAEPSVNNTPYLYVTRNFGMSAMYTTDDLSAAAKVVKDKVVVKLENLNNFDVFAYDKKGRKIHHNFVREHKEWDSLEYLDENGETQIATNVQSANIWYCDEIKYNTKHLCQGNTNFINNPNAPVGNGLYVGDGHGCEVMQYVKFFIDGKDFDVSVSSDELVGNEFKMIMMTHIYPSAGGIQYVQTNIPKLDTSGNPIVLFKHFMEVTITSDSDVIVDNKLEICQDNVSWLSCDSAMMECNFGDFNTVVLSGRGKTYMSSLTDEGTPTAIAGTDGVVDQTAVYASKVEMYGKGFYVSNEIIPMFNDAHCIVYPNYYNDRLKCYLYPVRCSRAVGSDAPQIFNTGDIIATHNIRHVRLSDDIEV